MNLKLLIDLFTTGGPWGLVGGMVGYFLGLVLSLPDPLDAALLGFFVGFSSPLWFPLFKKP